MSDLASRSCKPCGSGVPPLTPAEIGPLLVQVDPGWKAIDDHHLRRAYKLRDFREALAFTNRVGEMAEEQGHHPDIHLAWGKVVVEIWTHKINGLNEADFVFAARCDEIYRQR